MIKLKYILTTFILLFSITINGQGIYCTSNSQYKTYGSRVISAYNSTYNSVNRNSNVMYSGSNIGYTTNIGYNNIIYNSSRPTYNNYYSGTYNPGSTSTSTGRSGPRKSAERPYSGGTIEDIIDWLRINTDSNWPSYVNEDYWEELKNIDPDAYDYAVLWYESHGQKFPGDPEDPFLTPVGEFPIGLLLILMFGYLFYKINNKRTKKL